MVGISVEARLRCIVARAGRRYVILLPIRPRFIRDFGFEVIEFALCRPGSA